MTVSILSVSTCVEASNHSEIAKMNNKLYLKKENMSYNNLHMSQKSEIITYFAKIFNLNPTQMKIINLKQNSNSDYKASCSFMKSIRSVVISLQSHILSSFSRLGLPLFHAG